MRRPLRLVALLGLAALAAGCSTRRTLAPDLPPETTLFVDGKLDTVNHVVRLRWFGSDQDGSVVGFEFRFRRLDPPADSSWHFTTANDSLFTVWSPTGAALPVFDVRAIDDAGERDPTPASADFAFSNQPPVVRFTDAPAPTDTTFPATTVSWTVTDPDGDPAKAHYLLWLDGREASPVTVTGHTYTVPPSMFTTSTDVFYTGVRTLYLQAVDDGGLAGNVASVSWVVRAPAEGDNHAELLLLDDVSTGDAVDYSLDTLYTNAAARDLQPGRFVKLSLKTSHAFRSQQDLAYALSLFDAVAWTRGTINATRSPDYLVDYGQALADYVTAGGKLLLEGSYLIQNTLITGTTGALDPGFVESLIGFPLATSFTSSGELTYQWGFRPGGLVRNGAAWASTGPGDTLMFGAKPTAGITAFAPADTSMVLMWARGGTMTNDANLPDPKPQRAFAVSVPEGAGGRLVMIGCSLYAIDRPGYRSAPAILDRLFQQFGITGPPIQMRSAATLRVPAPAAGRRAAPPLPASARGTPRRYGVR